jgi:2'-5' RNA ligase
MPRLFVALAIPPEIGEPLLLRQAGVEGARWRPLEALHVTLRFFGEVDTVRADDLDLLLSDIASPPITLALEAVGAFGEGPDIHAVWAGVAENPALRRLAKACESAARRVGLASEARAYRPHVTLAYLSRPRVDEVGRWVQANALLRSPSFTLAEFGLYSSQLGRGGARYRLEASYPLRGAI